VAEYVNKAAEHMPAESTAPPSVERKDPTHNATGIGVYEQPERIQRQINPVVSIVLLLSAVLIVAYLIFQWFT